MNVMVSARPYWVPVFEGFKQAASDGLRGDLTRARPTTTSPSRSPRSSRILVKPAEGHPAAPDAGRPVYRADQPRNRQRVAIVTFAADSPNSKRTAYITSDNLAEGKFAAEEIAEADRRQGRVCGAGESRARATTTCASPPSSRYMEAKCPDMKLVGAPGVEPGLQQGLPGAAVDAAGQPEPRRAMSCRRPARREGAVAGECSRPTAKIVRSCTPTSRRRRSTHQGRRISDWRSTRTRASRATWASSPLFLAAHPDLIDPFNDYKRSGYNPMSIPFIDNGFAVVTKPTTPTTSTWDVY